MVTPKRLEKIKQMAQGLIRMATTRARVIPSRQIASFTGLAQSCYLAIPPARFFLRALHDCVGAHAVDCDGQPILFKHKWNASVRLSHQALQDLRWWSKFDEKYNGRAIWLSPDTAVLHCDASKQGWGGVLNHTVPAHGFWRAHQQRLHITELELRAVRYTVETFVEKLANRQVLLWEDNQAVVQVLTNHTSRSPRLMRQLRFLWFILDMRCIALRPFYIRSEENIYADGLSRERDHSDWRLHPRLFNSRWADPASEAVDAFTQSDAAWRRELNWCNPPWELLPRLVQKLRNSGAAAIVLAPYWPSSSWMLELREMAEEWKVVPAQRDLFLPGRLGSHQAVGKPDWAACAFRIPLRSPQPH